MATAAEITDRLARVLHRVAATEPVRTLEGIAASFCNHADRLSRPDAAGRTRYPDRLTALAGLLRLPAHEGPRTPPADDGLASDPRFAVCLRVARRAIAGALPDPTGGATLCHAIESSPRWARARTPSHCIGRFLFYRDAA